MVTTALKFLLSPIYSGALAPEHRDDLQKSVTDDTIQLHGFRSVPPSMIRPLLGWDSPRIRSAYLLPYPDPLQPDRMAWLDHVVLRLFPPFRPLDAHGQPTRGTIKYAQPKGTPPRLYFPRLGLVKVLSDPDIPLFVVEGQKKSLAVAETGRAAVGIQGIEGWHVAGSRALLPDFDLIPLQGRTVELVPDGDWRTNRNVERGVRRFVDALEQRGAHVRLVVLPAWVA
jgi:hypothetical protein